MALPHNVRPLERAVATHLPALRPAQQRGLAVWVYGTILAQSACQNAVVAALLTLGRWHALRQHLREWLYDGADRAAPCGTQVDVSLCFAPLLRWLLSWWQSDELALAVDATAHGDEVVALVVSVLYRGSAIPVAWHIRPANQDGAWMSPLLRLLRLLHPAVPPTMTVLVLADRGLWSPRLWKRIRDLNWHPLLRVKCNTTFQPDGQGRRRADRLVPGPGHAWVGRGIAFSAKKAQRRSTLAVVWEEGHAEPWAVLTDLPPDGIGAAWYGLRVWVELGLRALKGLGWQWQKTRRTDPTRVSRHWLVLATATLIVLADGTRIEDATTHGVPPARLRTPPASAPARRRLVSVFRQGLGWLCQHMVRGYFWRRLWLAPEAWPGLPPDVVLTCHAPP